MFTEVKNYIIILLFDRNEIELFDRNMYYLVKILRSLLVLHESSF